MRTHTVDFKEEIKNPGRQIDSIITYDGGSLSASDLKNVKPILNSEILKSVMKGLNFDSYRELNEGLEINYQFGLWIPSREEYEYLDYGNYIVYSKELNEDTGIWSYKCYDKMVYAMVDYEPFGITFPITVRNYINAFATHLGLTFKNINDEFTNYNKEINEDHYIGSEGEKIGFSIRDIFDEISSVVAGSLIVNNDDELEIKYFTETNDIIDEHYLKDVNVKFGKTVGPYNTVYLTRAADSDTIYRPRQLPENIIPITISENQIMNGTDREQFIDEIYQRLNGLEYCINDFASTGVLYYEFGDIYTVNIGENNYKCIMLNDEPVIQGGIVENIFSNEIEESTIDYEKADVTDSVMRQTILYVDKKNGEIVGRVGNLEDEYSQLALDINGLSLDVTQRGDNLLKGTAFPLDSLENWGDATERSYTERTTPPDSSEGWQYWYCTQTSENYTNGVIYEYVNNTWVATDLTRKELEEEIEWHPYANLEKNAFTMNNFISQKAVSLSAGVVGNIYYSGIQQRNVILDRTKENITLSFKASNTVNNGRFGAMLIMSNNDDNETFQFGATIPVSEELKQYQVTLPIISNKSVVVGYKGIDEPTEYNYWIRDYSEGSYYWKLYEKQQNDNEEGYSWVEIHNKIFKDVATDIYYYPQTIGEFGNIEYIYSSTNYTDFDTINLRVDFFIQLEEGQTTQDGDTLIGDIKVEYGTVATDWTNNRDELSGINYKMDSKGFEIRKGDYILHLDEDEMTGTYQGEVQFQLNAYNTYSKVGKFVETNQDGLITKKLSNNMYIRYIE